MALDPRPLSALAPSDAAELLAGRHHELRAVVEAGLEGRIGRLTRTDGGEAVRLDVGCYAFFGGDADAPAARELATSVEPPVELVYPDRPWRELLLDVHGGRLRDRPMRTFRADALDRDRLTALAESVEAPYVVRPLDADAASGLEPHLRPHGLQTHSDADAFLEGDLPRGAFLGSDDDRRLVAHASPYARSSRTVEVCVATHPDHRGHGLATAVAAAHLLAVLDAGLEPVWNAANPVSKRLARRLGFVEDGVCEILYLG